MSASRQVGRPLKYMVLLLALFAISACGLVEGAVDVGADAAGAAVDVGAGAVDVVTSPVR